MKKIILPLLLSGLCSAIMTTAVFGQQSTAMTSNESDRIDSLNASRAAQEVKTEELKVNAKHLSDLKSEKSDTKEKAKEARRIERDANDAARESRMAYKTEKKAQKMRSQADKQAKKAAKARSVSDDN